MRATIAGLTWDIASPSFYRLVPPPYVDQTTTVDVSFLDDKWFLFLEQGGRVKSQPFHTRDSALAMVARAFHNARAI